MHRRTVIKAAAAAMLARPFIVEAEAPRTLTFVPQADIAVLDPVWTTAYVTRNHGLMVFDTLFGQDASFTAQPQMAQGITNEDGGRLVRITLRPGLRFHDNTPVLARDCAASIRRWGGRDPFGQALLATTDELSAVDDRTLQFRLKGRFPVADALARVTGFCAIMPERLAATDPFTQVTEMVGSGPFRFLADEHVSGAHAGYRRFEAYQPRENEASSLIAGAKIAHFDKVDWNVIPDVATAAAALQQGEVDWWERVDSDHKSLLSRNSKLRVFVVDVSGTVALMRMNQLLPPFDKPAVRRALLGAVQQSDFMQVVAGDDHTAWRDDVGFFPPGTPMASEAGMTALTSPRDYEATTAAIKAAGYQGERVVVLSPGDLPTIAGLSDVGADMLRRCGMNVDLQVSDWGSIVQRRVSREPLSKGGWSVFFSTASGSDMANPAVTTALRGNGLHAWFGWPDAPKLEALRDRWLAAPGLADQKAIAEQEQLQAFNDVPYLPLGQYFQSTAQVRNLADTLLGLPLFWSIRRAA